MPFKKKKIYEFLIRKGNFNLKINISRAVNFLTNPNCNLLSIYNYLLNFFFIISEYEGNARITAETEKFWKRK